MFELLIVDDSAENLRVLQSILQPSGYRIRAATNCEVALKLVDKQRPDLVVSDVNMSEMSGLELCKQLRQKSVTVILASAFNSAFEIEQALDAGASDILTKPYRPAEVQARVRSALVNQDADTMHNTHAMSSFVDELVVGVANEINTPLGTTILTASHMKETILSFEQQFREQKVTSAKLKDFIHFCHDSVDLTLNNLNRVTNMMEMFRSISASDREEHVGEFNVVSIVEKVVGHFHAKLGERGIVVKIDSEPLTIHSDNKLLELVLTNLISNTLSHAYPEGNVKNVHVSWLMVGDKVEIVYWDHGVGMTDQQLEKLTTPFYTTKRGRGGHLGLGATIAANIIQGPLNGQYQVTSDSEKGLKWRLLLPIRA
ncbi:response regulator [Vibrio sp. SCSIO 43136]|uniref:response regulator n=1 Tax=Vibrio sp. SCSIO 43136 TaxID=2819101 RepID=UPI0020750BCE|nr:response regulator [Vibrio sp. SCSIO 43136]USD67660.1 response regulator [Vibrio sp. SCSIO 43136]